MYFKLHLLFLINCITVGAIIGVGSIFTNPLYAQDININLNAYKTAFPANEVRDWDNPATWEVWDGAVWIPATAPPNRDNDVFIEKDKEVRLIQNQEIGNLYLYGQDIMGNPPGKKIDLQEYNLDVYGALISFGGVDGSFYLQPLTSGITDWIYPEIGNIVFKGTSRTIVDRASWSASNGNSRFGVIFNPDPGEILTVNAAFKANSFVVQSGTVIQSVNTEGTEATSTFSFNTQETFGAGSYGKFIIEPGATLISDATRESGEIIRRSMGNPAADFHLKEGGALILNGEEPVIEAENILMEGDVHYSGDSGNQQFISGSMVLSPITYNNLFFEGEATKILPGFIELKGDLTYMGGGGINGDMTTLVFLGEGDQNVVNIGLVISSVEIRKPSGTLYINGDLAVTEHFTMTEGEVDFLDNQLYINLSGNGSYIYYGGSWKNMSQLNYLGLPPELNALNTTFPFEDQQLGGERHIFLSGTNSSENANLTITYTQLPGVNWDPDFDDNDGTPILYKLNSYFTLEVTNAVEAGSLELLISADSLIVVNEEDLRIVSDEVAASGAHLSGMDDGVYLARRSLNFNDLNNETFTIGSTGIASILPVSWLSYAAEELFTGNLISWSTTKEVENEKFIILKSIDDGADFEEIGEVAGSGNSNKIQHYSFLDKAINTVEKIFYQIKQVDQDGNFDFSPVFSLKMKESKLKNQFKIFPNPYEEGELTLIVPQDKRDLPSTIEIKNISGMMLIKESGKLGQTSHMIINKLKELGSGAYFITIETSGERQILKWLKKY
ncbi:MAG: T9SS type A sorting domain-containing protein [Anditalea sp.]